MLKRFALLLATLLSLCAPALAEVYAGKTVALESVPVCADGAGTIGTVLAVAGQRVAAGDALAELQPERVFATQDGTVCLVSAAEGDAVDGEALQVAPVERYTLHCTVDKAWQSAASTCVHCGETLFARCTSDGTHRAVGVVASIDGGEYRVLALGGELYVGETVWLYRDDAFSAEQRVGVGTVVASDTRTYEAKGRLTRLCVAAGDIVERGQLLYEVNGGAVVSAGAGILAEVRCRVGDAVSAGQVVAVLVPDDAVGVEIEVDEAGIGGVAVGDAASLAFAGREDGYAVPGTVVEIRDAVEPGVFIVRIRPETPLALPLGMSVEARL